LSNVSRRFLMVSSLSSARPDVCARWSRRFVMVSELTSKLRIMLHSEICKVKIGAYRFTSLRLTV
jgi:hypothetical protein